MKGKISDPANYRGLCKLHTQYAFLQDNQEQTLRRYGRKYK